MRGYSDDEIGVIAGFLRQGLSAGKIAAEMSAVRRVPVTRNAMIGIIRRDKRLSAIGLKAPISLSRGGGRRPAAKVAPTLPVGGSRPMLKSGKALLLSPKDYLEEIGEVERDRALNAITVPLPPARPKANLAEPPRAVPLVDLGSFDCHFAVNNAAPGEQHLFCGLAVAPGSSYCAHHDRRCRTAWVPAILRAA